jgi:hypothetical protein
MDFEHAAIALLASMVLVLAGMVGWLYWQQTRIFQNMNNIVMAVSELARPPPPAVEEQPVAQVQEQEEDDDRVSVDTEQPVITAEALVIAGPPEDTDDLEGKSKKELQDILSKRGIPFSKSDNKNALVSLLKATS